MKILENLTRDKALKAFIVASTLIWIGPGIIPALFSFLIVLDDDFDPKNDFFYNLTTRSAYCSLIIWCAVFFAIGILGYHKIAALGGIILAFMTYGLHLFLEMD